MGRQVACVIAFCAAFLIPRAAEACSCAGGIPPCEATWQVDAVLVAQVVSVERTSTHVRAHLLPLETFRGPSGIVSIDTGQGGGDCGYAFQPGETYLIYARGSAGRYSTGICSRTRPISEALEDLDYLRTTARTPSNLGVLRGTAWRTDTTYGGPFQRAPYPDLLVTVRGAGIHQEIRTDASGRYELQLPPGQYEVQAVAPPGLYTSVFRRVELRNARGCAEIDIGLHSDGRINGRVIDVRGQPVAGLPLELVARVSYGFTRVATPIATASDGSYEFTRVPPGSFYIAFDTLRPAASGRGQSQRLFLPGTLDPEAAAEIVLRPAERRAAPDFVMSDATGAVRVSGQVRTPDGQPVEGAQVYIRIAPPTPRFFFAPPAVSDRNGEFAMIVPGDAVYDVTVELRDEPQRARSVKQTIRPLDGHRWIDVVIPATR